MASVADAHVAVASAVHACSNLKIIFNERKIAPNEIFWGNLSFISENFATFAAQIQHSAPMKQAMIFAAGLGTRLKPLTDTMPKALVRVGGQPLLWHVIQKLKLSGYERIVVNVHHFAEQIVDYLKVNNYFDIDIRISDETSELLETGGGIKKAMPLFDPAEPILIHNVDILSNLDLEALPMDAPLLVVSERKTKRYLQFDDTMRLQGWINIETGEQKGPITPLELCSLATGGTQEHSTLNTQLRNLAFSGIHVFHPSLVPLLDEWPDKIPIMDFYLKASGTHLIRGYEAKNLRLMDVGKLNTLHDAEAFIESL